MKHNDKKVTMNLILLFIATFGLFSCSEISKIITENRTPVTTPAALPTTKSKKISTSKKELPNNMTFEATPEEGGFIISFDPFMEQNDKVFANICNHLLTKLYNDKIQDESHISIKSDIDYIIFKGYKARYRAVPFKESDGEISSMTLSLLK
jgi:hypothetical protein